MVYWLCCSNKHMKVGWFLPQMRKPESKVLCTAWNNQSPLTKWSSIRVKYKLIYPSNMHFPHTLHHAPCAHFEGNPDLHSWHFLPSGSTSIPVISLVSLLPLSLFCREAKLLTSLMSLEEEIKHKWLSAFHSPSSWGQDWPKESKHPCLHLNTLSPQGQASTW